MASAISCKVDVDIDLEPLYAEFQERLGDVTSAVLKQVRDDCPVDTGHMKSTISSDQGYEEAEITVSAEYAFYTEYKPNTSCTGWFSSAVDKAKPEVQRIWTKPF